MEAIVLLFVAVLIACLVAYLIQRFLGEPYGLIAFVVFIIAILLWIVSGEGLEA
jgi:hypothetical protein